MSLRDARIGVVDYKGEALLSSYVYVNPKNVVDYITRINGITPAHLASAPTFETIRPRILALLKDKILVGHAVYNDLAHIHHRHTYEDVRDTSLYYPLRAVLGIGREGEYPSLKRLYKEVFGTEIQVDTHDPVEDARASMRLFMHVREEFETALASYQDCVAGIPRSYEKWFW
ncbi:ribonuclease H-like domain-containing protein [Papiliotrema laurentii]|uniref:Ribonuclease H-like domain-containing protein n=1 Tax=Papiliotrema laurentii TaxID=5418 RepID=A0AAD9FLQ6_PAPLA|nr:ribonuclease H-like domain-containing protein [Papiliotrema laurentii]